MPKNPETPDEAQKKLNDMIDKYATAYEEEFALASKNQADLAAQAKATLEGGAVHAAETIVSLAKHAEKEAVRLRAAEYIYERCYPKELGLLTNDPLEGLVKELTQTDEA